MSRVGGGAQKEQTRTDSTVHRFQILALHHSLAGNGKKNTNKKKKRFWSKEKLHPNNWEPFKAAHLGKLWCPASCFGFDSRLERKTSQPAPPLLAQLEICSFVQLSSLIWHSAHLCVCQAQHCAAIDLPRTWSVRKSACPPGYQWHHPSEKRHLPLLSLIDSLGSVLRVPAQPDLLRQHLSAPPKALGNNPLLLPLPANSVYLLTLREAMNAALTDKQSYDAAFMSGLNFFSFFFLFPLLSPSLSSLFSPFPWTSQSVVSLFSPAIRPVDTGIRHFSHGGVWDMLVAITIHEAARSTPSPFVSKRCLSSLLLPLLSLSARGG